VSPAEGVAEAASGPEVVVPVWYWPRCDPGVPGIDRPGAPGPLAAGARGETSPCPLADGARGRLPPALPPASWQPSRLPSLAALGWQPVGARLGLLG